MMLATLSLFLISFFCLPTVVTAQGPVDPQLTGTWTTKSQKVLTGRGFYNPQKDRFVEPSHTGISYSFSEDGFFEEAYFRAVSDATSPECSKGVMQFQHGTYRVERNGSLILTPFSSDGRQLVSNPCISESAEYYRYIQEELFERYEVLLDPFHKIQRLNLYRFDGSPLIPMYLAARTPEMLPTHTLNPTDRSKTAVTARSTAAGERKAKAKRTEGSEEIEREFKVAQPPRNKSPFIKTIDYFYHSRMDRLPSSDKVWWIGVIMTSIGGIALIYK
ncbi:protein ROT1 [Blastomyces dermatitidis ER-3]|uniref:Protein ROT1 n=2 Tax=Blastomyces TaxID=229219 RepID=A0A179U862_BLAGS|nr:protein ROT1 [Blastomyces gilchristii SLH14081]XP_045277828.1 protein ROT1 [Blastomyces dermatitidis ER-3]EEQ91261.1 protein ROT1 [Blastomyces dermatitidis ER-3]EQL31357.1 protein ROT1 [Blastomyces dermatitidis ATCC 26199]OAT04010.1 protein ROT1 [Blastomyces gilchristii SLH14081]